MTIKQIKKIRDFGIYQKFDWETATPDFNNFNLTYGWNYCGKTTLSRVFRCFELGQKHSDYSTASLGDQIFRLALERKSPGRSVLGYLDLPVILPVSG